MSSLKHQTQCANRFFSRERSNTSNSLSRSRKSRSALRSSATRMVMAISMIFLVLELPAFFSKALEWVLSPLVYTLLGAMANVFTTLESFSIFWAYILMNRRFRNRLLALLRCRCLRWGGRINSSSSHTASYTSYSHYTDYSTYSEYNQIHASATHHIGPVSAISAAAQPLANPKLQRPPSTSREVLNSPLFEIELETIYTSNNNNGCTGQSILVVNQIVSPLDPLAIKPACSKTPPSPIFPEPTTVWLKLSVDRRFCCKMKDYCRNAVLYLLIKKHSCTIATSYL